MKRAFILSVVFLIINIICNARESNKIDSLVILLNNASNELLKANIYIEISNCYWSDDPDLCKENAAKALDIGKRLNARKVLFNAYKNIGAASAFSGKYRDALNFDLMSFQEAVRLRSDSLLCNISVNIGNDYTTLGKYDSANIYFDLGIKLASRLNLKRELCDLYLNKGNNQYYNSKLAESEACFGKGLSIALVLKDEDKIVMFYNNIASIRLYRGISDSIVISYIKQAIQINEKNGNNRQLADCYTTMASAYSLQGNNDKTLYYLKLAYERFRISHDEVSAIPTLCSLADLYREMNLLDSADLYADRSIKLGEGSGYLHGLASAYSVKGFILSNKGEFKSAEKILRKAFNEFIEINAAEGILFSGNQLAVALAKQGKYTESTNVSRKVFELAKQLSNYQALKNISLNLANVYSMTGDYKQAFNYLQIASMASDTINNAYNKKLLEEMEAKYKTEKKDNEIQILNLTKKQQAQTINEQRKRQHLYGVIISILVLLSVLLFWGIANRRRKEQLALNLKVHESELKALRSQMNPHFIFNSVQTIERLLNESRISDSKLCLDRFSNLTRTVLENSNKREISLKEELDTLKLYIELEKLRFSNPFEYDIRVEEGIDPETTLIPPLILQPFVENALKHGFRDETKRGMLSITIIKENDFLRCTVEDNGVGRKHSMSIKPVSGFKKESLGLKITEERLNLISESRKQRAYFKIEDLLDKSDNPLGTRVLVFLPYEQSI
jgi:tetratricopeptide (TPR) repeat protein